MGSIIHLQPEAVLEVSRALIQTAEEIDIAFRTLLDKARNIPWESPRRERYVSEYRTLVQNALKTAAEGETLGLRLRREVEEWLEVDANGKKKLEELSKGPKFTEIGPDWFRTLRRMVDPYDLSEVLDFLDDTEAGRRLIEEARRLGICFKILPEGILVGDPDGKIVTIRFDQTEPGTGGYQNGDEIVVSDSYLGRQDVGELASTMGHEMQHALDRQNGDLQSYEGIDAYLDDPAQLESFLEHRTETRIASEVRAYESGDSILGDNAYQDDGITTTAETEDILYSRGYESIYEEQLNKMLEGRYTVDCWTDGDGKVQVTLTPIQTLTPMA